MSDPVQGTCREDFHAVREEFERNLRARDELGASVHFNVAGETGFHLLGGLADPAVGRPWA